jgi:hypothetical protein
MSARFTPAVGAVVSALAVSVAASSANVIIVVFI